MLKAKDIMSREVITVSPDTEIGEVARLLLEKRLNGLPVLDSEGKLVGIVCQSDLVAQQTKIPVPSIFTILDTFIPISSPARMEREMRKISALTVGQAMSSPVTVSPDTPLEEIAALMVDKNFHTIPVIEGGKVVGIIGKEDVLRTLVPGSAK